MKTELTNENLGQSEIDFDSKTIYPECAYTTSIYGEELPEDQLDIKPSCPDDTQAPSSGKKRKVTNKNSLNKPLQKTPVQEEIGRRC